MTENPRLDLLVRQTSGFPGIAVDASPGGAVNSVSHSFPSFMFLGGKENRSTALKGPGTQGQQFLEVCFPHGSNNLVKPAAVAAPYTGMVFIL